MPVFANSTPAGAGYVIHSPDAPPSPSVCSVVESLPAEAGRVTVLVTQELDVLSAPVIAAFKQILARRHRFGSLFRHRASVRLLVPHAGSGRPAPAALLAKRLGCTVVAPSGSLWVVPDHSLLVRGRDDMGAWRLFAPDGQSTAYGSRFPSPDWQPELLTAPRDLTPDCSGPHDIELAGDRVSLEAIPSGIWLRAPGSPPATADEVAFAAVARSDQFVILVGGAEASEAVSPRAVAELLRRLPAKLRRIAVIVERQPYDGLDRGPVLFVAAVASLLDEPVLASPGLPLLGTEDGTVSVTTTLGNGAGWRTFASLVEFRPGLDHPVVLVSTPPLPGWSEQTRGVWPLVLGWEVEIIQAGLWIRPEAAPDPGATPVDDPRQLPVNPAAPILVVTASDDTASDHTGPDRSTPPLSAAAIDLFTARLPMDVRQILRRTPHSC
ncbi:MAG: hypothetical protein JXA67_07360 [Micromonosporaceae bacterium]|nr:hypothetical protein [Micromonosporaceae bacterium]